MLRGLLLGLAPGAAIGVGRFAYALVLPAMRVDLGLSFAQSGALGSANTGGYLAGALISHRVLGAVGYRRGLTASLLLQAVTLLLLVIAPAYPMLLGLRFAQGMLGAFVFVGGAALLLASGARAAALGLYFGGVGLGIVVSPLALPLFADWRAGWGALGALSLLLSLGAMTTLPGLREPEPPAAGSSGRLRSIAAALLAYGLYGAGYIGYMTFVTTGLTVPLGPFWAVLGAGAMLTGWVWGPAVERLGPERALLAILTLLTLSSLFPLVVAVPYLSAFLFGVTFLGVITAITALFRERLPTPAWPRAMGLSTASFALGQALGPGISGVVGDVLGGAAGALWAGSALLAAALVVAWWARDAGAERG